MIAFFAETLPSVLPGAGKYGATGCVGERPDNPQPDQVQSRHDGSTLSEILKSEIKRSERTAPTFALLIFDLTGTTLINESRGHWAGDRALCRLANVIRFSCRAIDTAGRYRDDEIAIILSETGAKEANVFARRIYEQLSEDPEEPALNVTVGFAVYPEDGTTIETLFQAADHALAKLKQLRKTA